MVLIFLNLLVVKFPNPRFDWWGLAFKHRKSMLEFVLKTPSMIYDAFLYAVTANITEALIWRQRSAVATFLVPVFSIVVLSFQRYVGEDAPSGQELTELLESLSPKMREGILKCDMHEYGHYNWRKTPKGLKLIDYAMNPSRTAWAHFLSRASDEMNVLTARI